MTSFNRESSSASSTRRARSMASLRAEISAPFGDNARKSFGKPPPLQHIVRISVIKCVPPPTFSGSSTSVDARNSESQKLCAISTTFSARAPSCFTHASTNTHANPCVFAPPIPRSEVTALSASSIASHSHASVKHSPSSIPALTTVCNANIAHFARASSSLPSRASIVPISRTISINILHPSFSLNRVVSAAFPAHAFRPSLASFAAPSASRPRARLAHSTTLSISPRLPSARSLTAQQQRPPSRQGEDARFAVIPFARRFRPRVSRFHRREFRVVRRARERARRRALAQRARGLARAQHRSRRPVPRARSSVARVAHRRRGAECRRATAIRDARSIDASSATRDERDDARGELPESGARARGARGRDERERARFEIANRIARRIVKR